MFGALRFTLALMVVVSHLSGVSNAEYLGYYAVRGFFFLSGFVITSSLNEIYAFDLLGFCKNRALRLLPLYYTVSLASLVIVLLLPSEASKFASFWAHPTEIDLLANFAILPLQFGNAHFRLVMPAWSIAVEITMYCFMAAVFSRREKYCYVLLLFGILYHANSLLSAHEWQDRYFSLQSATLSFSLGSLAYFWRKNNRLRLSSRYVPTLLAAWACNMIVACMLSKTAYVFGWGYYLNIVLAGALILALADWRPGKFFAELDQRFGDLAYPIFLSHWLVAFVIATLISQGARNWVLLLETIPGVLLFSAILARVNAIYIEPKRRDVRHRSLERVEGNGVPGAVLAH